MAVLGIGVDVCDVARVARLVERTPRSRERLFSPGEIAYAGTGPAAAERLAARFAAKEAVIKALGGAVSGMSWHDITVDSDGAAPRLVLAGAAADQAVALGIGHWHLSLSHDAGVVIAMVVAES
ncbi:MAG TPA: holo-ACP synthase [Mycobacteriales bacterium]|nr:holo-ACP synthase [Mycobacteriales bacterium]